MELPRWAYSGVFLGYDKSNPTYFRDDVVSLDISSPQSRSINVCLLEGICSVCTFKSVFGEFMGADYIK